jgi:hypothetical protein
LLLFSPHLLLILLLVAILLTLLLLIILCVLSFLLALHFLNLLFLHPSCCLSSSFGDMICTAVCSGSEGLLYETGICCKD